MGKCGMIRATQRQDQGNLTDNWTKAKLITRDGRQEYQWVKFMQDQWQEQANTA